MDFTQGGRKGFDTLFTLEAGEKGLVRASLKVPPRLGPRDRLSIRVRVPGGKEVTHVTVNDRPHVKFDRAAGTIDLTGHSGDLTLVIQCEPREARERR